MTFIEQKLEEFFKRVNLMNYEDNDDGHGLKEGQDTLLNECSYPESEFEIDRDKVAYFIKEALEQQAKEIISCLPEAKEIYNEEQVGVVGTHCIASNQHHGWNECLKEFDSNLEKKGLLNNKEET